MGNHHLEQVVSALSTQSVALADQSEALPTVMAWLEAMELASETKNSALMYSEVVEQPNKLSGLTQFRGQALSCFMCGRSHTQRFCLKVGVSPRMAQGNEEHLA